MLARFRQTLLANLLCLSVVGFFYDYILYNEAVTFGTLAALYIVVSAWIALEFWVGRRGWRGQGQRLVRLLMSLAFVAGCLAGYYAWGENRPPTALIAAAYGWVVLWSMRAPETLVKWCMPNMSGKADAWFSVAYTVGYLALLLAPPFIIDMYVMLVQLLLVGIGANSLQVLVWTVISFAERRDAE